MKNSTLTIATCQFDVGGDVDRNLDQMLQQIKSANSKKADVVHFPECCLTGYGGIQLKQIRKKDYYHLHQAVEKIMEIASAYGLYVIFGSHYYVDNEAKPKNSLFVISPKGQIEARYDKRILTGTEGTFDHLFYSHGDNAVIFNLNGINCGMVICHEWRYPEFYREYKKLGAELIFHSWFDGGFDDEEFQHHARLEGELIVGAVKGYAANNYLWISGSNISTKQSSFPSFVIQPNGQILSKSPRNKPAVLINKIDLSKKFTDPSLYGRQRFLS